MPDDVAPVAAVSKELRSMELLLVDADDSRELIADVELIVMTSEGKQRHGLR